MPAVPDAAMWPIAFAVVAIVATFALRAPLARLIDRTKKIGKWSASFDPASQEAPEQQPTAGAQMPSFEEMMRLPLTATALSREEGIKQAVQHLRSDAERVDVLVRANAAIGFRSQCLTIARDIFGSQIDLLVALVGTQRGLPLNAAREIFNRAVAIYPDGHANRSFEVWLDYLRTNELVTIQADRVDITQFGKDFGKFLIDERIAFPRVG